MSEIKRGSVTRGIQTRQVRIASTAAGTEGSKIVFYNSLGKSIKVKGLAYVPDAAIAAHADDYLTLTAATKTAAGGAGTEITAGPGWLTKTGEDGAMTAFVKYALALSSTNSALIVAAGQSISFISANTGNGKELAAGLIEVEFTVATA